MGLIPHYIQILIITLYSQNKIWKSIIYYPPSYERHAWYYKYENTAQIKNALVSFNWEQALSKSSTSKKISILNETITNVMSNYIPNKIKVFDNQKPPWMNAEIENLITAKNDILKNI